MPVGKAVARRQADPGRGGQGLRHAAGGPGPVEVRRDLA